ncbi:MAG: hypothetical protein IJR28_05200 [Ottowia sp.]|nr:hypothetical protein [Ottowia sp.]
MMRRIFLVGEDALCCALGQRLAAYCLPQWELMPPPYDAGGVTKLQKRLTKYIDFSRQQPVLCIADTDGKCAVYLLRDWKIRPSAQFVLRLAATEAESWVLADRQGFSKAFGVPLNKLPHCPDEEADPKRLIMSLVARSKVRLLREEMLAARDPSRRGLGYTLHLADFVRGQWDIETAAQHSPSLARAVAHVSRLAQGAA